MRSTEILAALGRHWRALATGFCFAVFGLGGLVVRLLVFPALLLVPGQLRRQRLARNLVHHSFRAFVWLMTVTGAISYEVRHAEKLRRGGQLVLANHPSLIDVVFLMSLVKQPDCVVKTGVLRNPFMRGPVRLAGFISNAYGPQMVEDAIGSVRSGNNLIIFPEGTRTVPGADTLHFQRGSANIAVRGSLDITPVIITCSEPMLTKNSHWYRQPPSKPHFVLTVLDDIGVSSLVGAQQEANLQARWLTHYLETFFQTEIARRGSIGVGN